MKQFYINILFFLLTTSGTWLKAQSPNHANVTGHVSAEVVIAFSAVETSQMNFGRFSPGPHGGEIILSPQGTVSMMGSVARGSGMHNAASFYLTGENSSTFSINLPKSSAVLKSTSDSKTMLVKDWVSTPGPGPGSGSMQEGVQTVYVGATLEVGTMTDNPVGIYKGIYTITFDFN